MRAFSAMFRRIFRHNGGDDFSSSFVAPLTVSDTAVAAADILVEDCNLLPLLILCIEDEDVAVAMDCKLVEEIDKYKLEIIHKYI